jgi:PPOX class probable F420-dependent enzyme
MPGGRASSIAELPEEPRGILQEARRGFLATVDSEGRPHAVPVCFAERDGEVLTPIDEKPKSGRELGRRKNLEGNAHATLVVDRWDEDWTRLGWVMVRGTARIEPVGSADRELVARYPQYEDVFVGSEVIVVEPRTVLWWTWE